MKSELNPAKHNILTGSTVVEIWYDGQYIGAVYGADGPGIRVISKHEIHVETLVDGLNVAEIRLK